jgi:hypothetical protein
MVGQCRNRHPTAGGRKGTGVYVYQFVAEPAVTSSLSDTVLSAQLVMDGYLLPRTMLDTTAVTSQ